MTKKKRTTRRQRYYTLRLSETQMKALERLGEQLKATRPKKRTR
ncbi:MAG TPA: hypothetical protein VNZ26_12630 [Vicinamibacterales bacterium]|jgi:hypothetical protein|nr:hypothetical protein [Vicinamibacterales bacterium]